MSRRYDGPDAPRVEAFRRCVPRCNPDCAGSHANTVDDWRERWDMLAWRASWATESGELFAGGNVIRFTHHAVLADLRGKP